MKRHAQTSAAALRGFTMIELLVTIAVMAILVVMLFSIVDASTKLWKDNENRVDAYREARAALNTISSDVANLLVSKNPNLFATNAIGSYPADMVTNGTIFFLVSLPPTAQDSTNKGEICTVGYYRRWTQQIPAASSSANLSFTGYHLYRTLYGSDATFAALTNATLEPLKNVSQPVDPTAAEILARNIISLDFRYYETNATAGQWKTWVRTPISPLPQMIEIRLTALSDDFAKRLSTSNDWTTNNPAIAKGIRTFVSRVQVPRLPAN